MTSTTASGARRPEWPLRVAYVRPLALLADSRADRARRRAGGKTRQRSPQESRRQILRMPGGKRRVCAPASRSGLAAGMRLSEAVCSSKEGIAPCRDLGAACMSLEEKDQHGRDSVQDDRREEEKDEPRARCSCVGVRPRATLSTSRLCARSGCGTAASISDGAVGERGIGRRDGHRFRLAAFARAATAPRASILQRGSARPTVPSRLILFALCSGLEEQPRASPGQCPFEG